MSFRNVMPSLLALAWLAVPLARGQVKPGGVFPDLASAGLVALTGGELPDTSGRVVLVDFWASWCTPCKASFPMMARLHADLAARGLVIAAISVDEKPAAAEAFVKKLAPPFPAWHDRAQKLVRQVVVPAMPTSYVIGRDGRVRHIHEGFHGERTERELRQQLEALLAETNPPRPAP
jgi:thiol-disulfide isomerase/thioredoxin